MSSSGSTLSAAEALAQDLYARKECQRNFTDHLVLEAGAGSGKTATLITRLLCWCLWHGWEKARSDLADYMASSEMHPSQIAKRVVSRVVAITFTEAAASEMSERMGRSLVLLLRASCITDDVVKGLFRESLEGLSDEEIQLRAKAILGVVDQMRICTIHAFCRSILTTYPLEANLHPSFEVDAEGLMVDEVARMVLLRDIQLHFQHGKVKPNDQYQQLYLAGIQSDSILQDLIVLLNKNIPSEDLAFSYFSPQNLAKTYGAINKLIEQLVPYIQQIPNNKRSTHHLTLQQLQELQVLLLQGLQNAQLDSAQLLEHGDGIQTWSNASQGAVKHIDTWRTKPPKALEKQIAPEALLAFQECCRKLLPSLRGMKNYQLRILIPGLQIMRRLLSQAEKELQKRGVMTFDGLLRHANRLLQKSSGARVLLRDGMDLLLVDEFQDTSQLQCDLVAAIGLDNSRSYPKLFIVGDPKQSIYGWRSADIRSYFAFVKKIINFSGPQRGVFLRLYQNFRSTPAILAEVHRCFQPLMQEVESRQPPFVPLVPYVQTETYDWEGLFSPVEHWISWPTEVLPSPELPFMDPTSVRRISASRALEVEANALALNLHQLCGQGNVAWKDCAVLLRSTTQLDAFIDALRRFGVPYAVTRDRNYYRRREIIDAAAMIRCIFDPLDQIALVSFLRSSAVGLPDAALFLLWRHGFPDVAIRLERLSEAECEQVCERLRTLLRAVDHVAEWVPGYEKLNHWQENFIFTLLQIRQIRKDVRVLSTSALLHKIRHTFAFELGESANHQGAYRLANLDRFFLRLHQALEQHRGDWSKVIQVIRSSVREALDAEEAKPKDSTADAVQIMTIHKSKGLDFEHVYVMQLHSQPGTGFAPEAGLTTLSSGRKEVCMFSAMTLGYVQHLQERAEVEKYERVRLLYVTLTRAKSRLVIAGKHPVEHHAVSQERAKTLLDLFGKRMRFSKEEQKMRSPADMASQRLHYGNRQFYDGARFVFPRYGVRGRLVKDEEYIFPHQKKIIADERLLHKYRQRMNLVHKHPNIRLDSSAAAILFPYDERAWDSHGRDYQLLQIVEQCFIPLFVANECFQQPQFWDRVHHQLRIHCPIDLYTDAQAIIESVRQSVARSSFPTRQIVIHNQIIGLKTGHRYRIHRLEQDQAGCCYLIELQFLSTYGQYQEKSMVKELELAEELQVEHAIEVLQDAFDDVQLTAEVWNLSLGTVIKR